MADGNQKLEENQNQYYKPPRIELAFPKFDLDNLKSWIFKCNNFFSLCQIPHRLKMAYVALHIPTGKAWNWYQCYVSDQGASLDWDKFSVDICRRFDVNFDSVDVLRKFKDLEQTGDVEEYMVKFEKLQCHMIPHFSCFEEKHYVDFFVAGLKPEIMYSVRCHEPTTLIRAYKLAKLQERYLIAFHNRINDEAAAEEEVVYEQEEDSVNVPL